jgi:hypothetical protein
MHGHNSGSLHYTGLPTSVDTAAASIPETFLLPFNLCFIHSLRECRCCAVFNCNSTKKLTSYPQEGMRCLRELQVLLDALTGSEAVLSAYARKRQSVSMSISCLRLKHTDERAEHHTNDLLVLQ